MTLENDTLGLVPTPRDGIELAELEGEGLLYSHDKMTMVYLNESARVVWRLCDGQRTIAQIIDALATTYPEAADQVGSDVPETIDLFVREGVLELTEA